MLVRQAAPGPRDGKEAKQKQKKNKETTTQIDNEEKQRTTKKDKETEAFRRAILLALESF